MSFSAPEPLQAILHNCASAAPNPWYPKVFAQSTGIDRDSLDSNLEKLRLAGLIQLTDWIPGSGQGYVLTPEREQLLGRPDLLSRLDSSITVTPRRDTARLALEEISPQG